jgi:hypothetical protein
MATGGKWVLEDAGDDDLYYLRVQVSAALLRIRPGARAVPPAGPGGGCMALLGG